MTVGFKLISLAVTPIDIVQLFSGLQMVTHEVNSIIWFLFPRILATCYTLPACWMALSNIIDKCEVFVVDFRNRCRGLNAFKRHNLE